MFGFRFFLPFRWHFSDAMKTRAIFRSTAIVESPEHPKCFKENIKKLLNQDYDMVLESFRMIYMT